MSWDSYITGPTGLMSRGPIAKAGIFGINGATWAQHQINPSLEEILALGQLFENPAPGYSNGFCLGGQQYVLLKLDGDSLYGKLKSSSDTSKAAITVQKTMQALVVAIGTPDGAAGLVNTAVGVIGDYLAKAGY